MKKSLVPNLEELIKTDWKKPAVDLKDVKSIILLAFAVISLIVVFIPWHSVGIGVEDAGVVKLRAFGFSTWYGIVGLFAALVSIAGVLYKHYSLTFCASLVAVIMGVVGMNAYPDSKLVIGFDDQEAEKQFEKEMNEVGLGSSPSIEFPGPVVALVSMAIDFVDQDVFMEVAKENVPELSHFPFENIDFISNRAGALIFLIFSILSALLSYTLLRFGDRLNFVQQSASDTEETKFAE